MRNELKKIGNEERHTFVAVFDRFGMKSGFQGRLLKTVLLINVCDDNGNIVTDHLWFNFTRGFEKLNLKNGDKIMFNGRVEKYKKGYFGYREDVYVPYSVDYKISRPTKIQKIN